MSRVQGFPPITTPEAHILILGSMPGIASLGAHQYYAHPRNAFWRIMAEVFGFDPLCTYEERVCALTSCGVAVWDVLQLCTRKGSLDSDIDNSSVVPNDFASFFTAHRQIQRICFNGAKAASLYKKHVLPDLGDSALKICYVQLPSTSPAHAGLSYAQKLHAWRSALV